jgi:hypothetical protein
MKATQSYVKCLGVIFAIVCIVTLELLTGCGGPDSSGPSSALPATGVEVRKIVSSEETILALTKRLHPLNRAAFDLKLPVGDADLLFESDAMVTDIGAETQSSGLNEYLAIRKWSIEPDQLQLDERGIWQNLFLQVNYFESAKFYFVDGQFDQDQKRFYSHMGFASHARMLDGSFGHIRAKMNVTWVWLDAAKTEMRIKEWKTEKLECTHSDRLLFEEVTRNRISDPDIAAELATSKHEEMTLKLILGQQVDRPKDDNYPFFFPEVTLEHPAVSVVDLDSDGFDDFFLVQPNMPTLFFSNNGNGTFAEMSSKIGLSLKNDCTCSLFADFDNDGDQDVFIGRARKRAVYLENEAGSFTDQTTAKIGIELPYMVSSISSADFDNDGLLDVYFSTYSPLEGSHGVELAGTTIWPDLFLNPLERSLYLMRRAKAHPFIDMTGPANLLLQNTGDGFVVSQHNDSVASWRKTFQASWSDFDHDGDQDLYVCNDFAPDDLYMNNREQGFRRVNEEVGLNQLGFGMGVAWGDHNNDGNLDLYVSNMYSKAGKRITEQIKPLDRRFSEMAAGNYLFEMREGRFELVSLQGESQQAVSTAGWSWGGQFADVDNDGNLDIYVASGYYSAPGEVAEDVDL